MKDIPLGKAKKQRERKKVAKRGNSPWKPAASSAAKPMRIKDRSESRGNPKLSPIRKDRRHTMARPWLGWNQGDESWPDTLPRGGWFFMVEWNNP